MEGFDLRNLLNPEHWLAMDNSGEWYLYEVEPSKSGFSWLGKEVVRLDPKWFSLPNCNWEESLIQVKDLIED